MDDNFIHDDWCIPKFESLTASSLPFNRTESFELVNNNQKSKSVISIASASEKILNFLTFGTNKKPGRNLRKEEKSYPKDSDIFWLVLNDSQPK